MRRRPPRSTRTDTLFPTRRSSDLLRGIHLQQPCPESLRGCGGLWFVARCGGVRVSATGCTGVDQSGVGSRDCAHRSEEHTSELQSLMRISYAVFSLKKKRRIENRRDGETLEPRIRLLVG